MLVLSRTEGDGISFPELDLAIQVLKVQGSRVQIGVSAAEEIRVLRSELLGRAASRIEPVNAEARHALRNRLNAISLAMSISQKHLERGDVKSAELALSRVAKGFGSTLDETDGTLRSSSPTDTSNSDPQTKIHALLVEDNLNEGTLLAEILRLHNIDVQVVQDGIEALLIMGIKKPDVVLLDMNMPNFDGKKTLEQIRKNAQLKSIPVYAVTGADKADMGISVGESEGVDEWFQKPVQPSKLLQALRYHCATAC
ncbi:MAG: response regulator [Pirellula sp.]|nr:response regulator [Pirellula sp.]